MPIIFHNLQCYLSTDSRKKMTEEMSEKMSEKLSEKMKQGGITRDK